VHDDVTKTAFVRKNDVGIVTASLLNIIVIGASVTGIIFLNIGVGNRILMTVHKLMNQLELGTADQIQQQQQETEQGFQSMCF
jgi:hypothetical protein